MVEAHAAMKSWIAYDASAHFPMENIPFGAFMNPTTNKVECCTRIGDKVISLNALEHERLFTGPIFSAMAKHIFCEENLNAFAALGPAARIEARETIQTLFKAGNEAMLTEALKADALFEAAEVKMHMPMFIRDYTDFYSSRNHAFNLGAILRGPGNELQPNWSHLPVGYHGRASSIVVDGTPIRRPRGQVQVAPDVQEPKWSPCMRMDFELEMGTFIGVGNELGTPIKVNDAREHIFGFTLLNDWSARDIQGWEYVPLGPFNAKNFASTISPWVITPEALAPFKVALPEQEPKLMGYLQDKDLSSYNINLEVHLKTPSMENYDMISKSNMRHLYYSVPQTIAHHSVTGCNMGTGDMLGTGTISGTDKSAYGCLIELTWKGTQPIKMSNGDERKFLQDGDTIMMRGICEGEGYTIGFGECTGSVIPALDESFYTA